MFARLANTGLYVMLAASAAACASSGEPAAQHDREACGIALNEDVSLNEELVRCIGGGRSTSHENRNDAQFEMFGDDMVFSCTVGEARRDRATGGIRFVYTCRINHASSVEAFGPHETWRTLVRIDDQVLLDGEAFAVGSQTGGTPND